MIKIYKISEYNNIFKLVEDFSEYLNNESKLEKDNNFKKNENILNKIIKDLNLNFNMLDFLGSGLLIFSNITKSLFKGLNIELTDEVVVLSTVCAITIMYLDFIDDVEKRNKLVTDSKNQLEELKLRGVGNGIIKKLIKAFESIKNFFTIISKDINIKIESFFDILLDNPTLKHTINSISFVIDKNNITLENIVDSFSNLNSGITTNFGKQIINDVLINLSNKVSFKNKKIISEIETPIIQKFGDKTFGSEKESGLQIIQEQ